MMRQLSFFFLSFLFSVSLFAQKRDYEVTLWIHQLEDSIVYVKGAYGQQNSIILDTLHLKKDGEFVLKGRFNSGIVVVASPKEDLFSFVLDKDSRFSLDIYPDGFYEVKGSLENDRYLEFQKMNMDYRLAKYEYELQMKKDPSLTDSLSALIRQKEKEFGDYRESFYRNYPENIMSVLVKAVQNPAPNMKFFDENGKLKKGMELEYANDYRMRFWDGFDFSDERIIATPYFYRKFQTYIDKVTMQTADSVFSSFKHFIDLANSKGGQIYSRYVIDHYLQRLPMMPFSFNEMLYTLIVDSLVNDKYTPWLTPSEVEQHKINIERIRPFLAGNPFPRMRAVDLDNRVVDLYDINTEYTVVFFWSANCESCKKNIEMLVDFYKNFKEKYNVEIYSVDLGNDLEAVKDHQTNTPFDWIVLRADPRRLKEDYNLDIDHTPELYVLDKNKVIMNKTAVYSHVQKVIELDREQKGLR